jgi:hypothetical protein
VKTARVCMRPLRTSRLMRCQRSEVQACHFGHQTQGPEAHHETLDPLDLTPANWRLWILSVAWLVSIREKEQAESACLLIAERNLRVPTFSATHQPMQGESVRTQA